MTLPCFSINVWLIAIIPTRTSLVLYQSSPRHPISHCLSRFCSSTCPLQSISTKTLESSAQLAHFATSYWPKTREGKAVVAANQIRQPKYDSFRPTIVSAIHMFYFVFISATFCEHKPLQLRSTILHHLSQPRSRREIVLSTQ